MIKQSQVQEFLAELWQVSDEHGRTALPWRQPLPDGSFDAYAVLVSEIMLQQTQVSRVIPKYQAFLNLFPSIKTLAEADWPAVLHAWSGLGYNRRAKYLHEAAKILHSSREPWSIEQLISLKGIGHNTAAATLVYSYNQPHIFIETNIRTVYLQHFFPGDLVVTDVQIMQVLRETLDRDNPREFYWALMDYGAWLKRQGSGQLVRSKTYKKQSPFEGSKRQLRGRILRELQVVGAMQKRVLYDRLQDERIDSVLKDMAGESLIRVRGNNVSL